jgi:alcohol dehydrogenase class IV
MRVFIVTGGKSMRKTGTLDRVAGMLECDVKVFEGVGEDPTTTTVDECATESKGCDLIIALGGGSPIDTAKVAAVINVNGGKCIEYLEGKKRVKKGLPLIAVPTTAGSGSEVSRVSVFKDESTGLKKSIKHEHLHADYAVVDPELTLTAPKSVTAASGMDALTHAVEAYVSKNASSMTDIFAVEAVREIRNSIREAYDRGSDIKAREGMSLGSLLAGLAFSNAGCGLAHGLASVIGGRFNQRHGVVCGMLLPDVIEYNLPAAGGEYNKLASGAGFRSVEDVVEFIRWLCRHFKFPEKLSDIGVNRGDLGWIASNRTGASKLNPREATTESVIEFLEGLL